MGCGKATHTPTQTPDELRNILKVSQPDQKAFRGSYFYLLFKSSINVEMIIPVHKV